AGRPAGTNRCAAQRLTTHSGAARRTGMGQDKRQGPRGIGMRARMWGRWGLQAKMTASYVLVTAAVVVLVEIVAAAVVLPELISGTGRATEVQLLASATANQVMQQSATLGHLPTASPLRLDPPPPRTP